MVSNEGPIKLRRVKIPADQSLSDLDLKIIR